ncbi:T6SS phospholipase effector Tle1-like catalytic domain-containing protein [Hydrogenophaga sp. MI9]|uniref:T6SS phospholipase effector Tle1-like catalytic domain-containing protein n=1 Tax=Hydrogenophaga sp. MI9 TaxID=3453719 RepID=UPI003EEC3273
MSESTPRQIILCCDGTNNNLTGGESDTNVVRLCQLLRSHGDDRQLVFYDPGVGNPGELPGATLWDSVNRYGERLAGLAFGRGVYENMAECYQFLMAHYRAGDELYIFGFSRGAFTARSVAGLVNMFGILQPHMVSMVPSLLHIYFSDRGGGGDHARRIARQTTQLFAGAHAQHVNIHFVGVWDTVASVGMPPFSKQFTARADVGGKRFLNVRQALALDEYRAQFAPRQYVDPNGEYRSDQGLPVSLKQLWFSGAHCDVGGGYVPDKLALADQAMGWLVGEAVRCGLHLYGADGRPLTDQQVLQALYADQPGAKPLPPVAHSELYRTPLWAVTGMAVRSPGLVEDGAGGLQTIPAQEHPSVQALSVAYPKDTDWAYPRPWLATIAWCLAFLLLYGGIGQMLLKGEYYAQESFWSDLRQVLSSYPRFLATNLDFVHWQMLWFRDGLAAVQDGHVWEGLITGLQQVNQFGSPRWSLLWDLGLILAYAQVLSRFCVAGFARGAGLRRVGQPVSRWLNRLGWALPLMVFADVGEDLFTWLTISLTHSEYFFIAAFTGALMALLALLKWIGLVGVIWLTLWPGRAGRRG